MQLPLDATVVVTDGQKLRLFRSTGTELRVALTELPDPDVRGPVEGAGRRQYTGQDNKDQRRLQDRRLDKDHQEASFGSAVAKWLNQETAAGRIGPLFVVAPPRALGELRLHYGAALKRNLLGELAKEHTGDAVKALEQALENALKRYKPHSQPGT